MSFFKTKGLDEEIKEFLEQEIEDLNWLDNFLRSLKNDKSWKDELGLISERTKEVNRLLKKLGA